MSNLLRRLHKLEAELTDRSGLVPHTAAWWDYWTGMLDKVIAGERLDELIPLEFVDALIAKGHCVGLASESNAEDHVEGYRRQAGSAHARPEADPHVYGTRRSSSREP